MLNTTTNPVLSEFKLDWDQSELIGLSRHRIATDYYEALVGDPETAPTYAKNYVQEALGSPNNRADIDAHWVRSQSIISHAEKVLIRAIEWSK